MYAILPRLVEESAAEDSPETTKGYMDVAVNFLQLVLYAFEDHRVSSAITAQFFGMVFCFINSALLNLLFSSDTDVNALTHTCGIRLKNCLDILKGWSNGVQLCEELQRYLAPLMSAVGLLCTPGRQLMRVRLKPSKVSLVVLWGVSGVSVEVECVRRKCGSLGSERLCECKVVGVSD